MKYKEMILRQIDSGNQKIASVLSGIENRTINPTTAVNLLKQAIENIKEASDKISLEYDDFR